MHTKSGGLNMGTYDDKLAEDPNIRRADQFNDWMHDNLSLLKDEYFAEPEVEKDFREYCLVKYEEMGDPANREYQPEEEI